MTNDAKILSAISGGNPPDIIDLGGTIQLASWANEGAIMPLNSFIAASKLNMSQFVPDALKPVTVNGQVYALPFMDFTAGLLYNKKLFAAAGLIQRSAGHAGAADIGCQEADQGKRRQDYPARVRA